MPVTFGSIPGGYEKDGNRLTRKASDYAPLGRELVSVTVVNPADPDTAEPAVRAQVRE